MIRLAALDIMHVLLFGLIVWAAIGLLRFARPLSFWRHNRWTIADWFDVVSRLSVSLAILIQI